MTVKFPIRCEEDISILQRGDLVEIERGCHSHWAVYTGDGCVIHLSVVGTECSSPTISSTPCVKMEKLFDVAGDSVVYNNNIYDDLIRPRPKLVLLEKALSMMTTAKYNLNTKNCEQFAIICRYEWPRSRQTQHTVTSADISVLSAMKGTPFESRNITPDIPSITTPLGQFKLGSLLSYQVNCRGLTDRTRIKDREDLPLLNRGDLVEIVRTRYSHWAVYAGEGFVIHLSHVGPECISSSSPTISGEVYCKPYVKMENLFDVAGDSVVYRNNIHDNHIRPKPKLIILEKALDMIDIAEYNFITNSCDHFATYCRYGRPVNCRGMTNITRIKDREDLLLLNIGDLIEIERTGYSHWAVYVGEGFVIHLCGVGPVCIASSSSHNFTIGSVEYTEACVRKDTLFDIIGNSVVYKNNSYDAENRPLDRRIIVAVAQSMLGNADYNVITSHCEHFATNCRYGRPVESYGMTHTTPIKGREDLLLLIKGDLIEFKRTGYSHWAVYVGEEFVIHLGPADSVRSSFSVIPSSCKSENGCVKKDNLFEVRGDSRAYKNNCYDAMIRPKDEEMILEMANSMLGTAEYNVLTNNCEHFAINCRYGIPFSRQIHVMMSPSLMDGWMSRVLRHRDTIHSVKYSETFPFTIDPKNRGKVERFLGPPL